MNTLPGDDKNSLFSNCTHCNLYNYNYKITERTHVGNSEFQLYYGLLEGSKCLPRVGVDTLPGAKQYRCGGELTIFHVSHFKGS